MDDIQLPPLPRDDWDLGPRPAFYKSTLEDYARAAVIADRERRKPGGVVYRKEVALEVPNMIYNKARLAQRVVLCWTDDGRAWIDSERNRELAARMREAAHRPNTTAGRRYLHDAADALDGGA